VCLFLGLHLIKYSIVGAYETATLMPPGTCEYCSAALWVLFTVCHAFVSLSIVTQLKGVGNCLQLMGCNGGAKTLCNQCGCYEMAAGVVVNLMGCVLCMAGDCPFCKAAVSSTVQVTRLVHFAHCPFSCCRFH